MTPLRWVLLGATLGIVGTLAVVLLVGRLLLVRFTVCPASPPPAAPGPPARRTPVEARESAAAVLNAADPARRRVIPHAPRKES